MQITAYGGMLKYKIDYQEPKKTDGRSDLRPYLPHIMILGGSYSLQVPVDSLDGKSRPKLELLEVRFKIIVTVFTSVFAIYLFSDASDSKTNALSLAVFSRVNQV